MHEKFMLEAIEIAKKGMKKHQSPFGSCIVKEGKIISLTHNTVFATKDPTAHAEINAIRAASKKLKSINLKGCTIYSTNEPCPMCFAAIHWAKISNLVYGTKIKDVQKLGFSELTIPSEKMKTHGNSTVHICGNFMREECLALLKLWKNGRRKTY